MSDRPKITAAKILAEQKLAAATNLRDSIRSEMQVIADRYNAKLSEANTEVTTLTGEVRALTALVGAFDAEDALVIQ